MNAEHVPVPPVEPGVLRLISSQQAKQAEDVRVTGAVCAEGLGDAIATGRDPRGQGSRRAKETGTSSLSGLTREGASHEPTVVLGAALIRDRPPEELISEHHEDIIHVDELAHYVEVVAGTRVDAVFRVSRAVVVDDSPPESLEHLEQVSDVDPAVPLGLREVGIADVADSVQVVIDLAPCRTTVGRCGQDAGV